MPNAVAKWFDVDHKGLASILERRGKEFAVLELFQNSADTDGARRISFQIEETGQRGVTLLEVSDDDPDGFKNLRDAYTLYSPSEKKGDPTKRGRFNLGEKLVICLCNEAKIISTTGSVTFHPDGRSHNPSDRIAAGTLFSGLIRMTKPEREASIDALRQVIVPGHITLTVNGMVVKHRLAIETIFRVSLDTEREDENGNLRRTKRQTELSLYEPPAGMPARLYEMGIPICDTEDRWDVDVAQKVPVSMERDGVNPAYLRAVRVAVANAMHEKLSADDTTTTWVNEALESPDVTTDAVRNIIGTRFGPEAFIHNPADPEATRIAVSHGGCPVYGKSLSRAAWSNVKAHGAMTTAPPSPKVELNFSAQGDPEYFIPEEKWSPGMVRLADYTKWFASTVAEIHITVRFTAKPSFDAAAAYGNRTLAFNKFRLGNEWIDAGKQESVDSLVIHELGHEWGDHLDSKYHDALCRMGARAIALARSGGMKSLSDFRVDAYVKEGAV